MSPLLKEILINLAPYAVGVVALDAYLLWRFRKWWQILLILLPTLALGVFMYIEVTISLVFGSIIDSLFRKH